MLKRISIVLLVFLILIPMQAGHAQQPDSWYFAWNNTTGEVVAYNVNGEVVPLITVEEVLPFHWRMSPFNGLVLMLKDGQVGLYQLTNNFAGLIVTDVDLPAITNLRRRAVLQQPYHILVSESGALGQGIMVNMAAGTGVITEVGQAYVNLDTWRFSEDNLTLRYLTHAPDDLTTWVIQGLDLRNNATQDIYTFSADYPAIQTNATGRYWLQRSLQGTTLQHILIDAATGESRILAEETTDNPTQYTRYQLFGDQVLTYPTSCLDSCSLELKTLEGASLQNFPIERISSPEVLPLRQLDDARWLVMIGNEYWILKSGEAAVLLGIYDGVGFRDTPPNLLSPDGNLLMVASAEDEIFQILDVMQETLIYEGQRAGAMTIQYESSGILINRQPQLPAVFLRYTDHEAVPLPDQEQGFYFTALADGALLYAQPVADAARVAGIYRFDPAAETFTLLVADVFPLVLR